MVEATDNSAVLREAKMQRCPFPLLRVVLYQVPISSRLSVETLAVFGIRKSLYYCVGSIPLNSFEPDHISSNKLHILSSFH
jgi:hypothetical protein